MITNLNDLLDLELQHLFSMEKQITETLPKIIRNVSSDDLRNALNDHLLTTEEQLVRLQEILSGRNIKPDSIIDQGTANILKESQDTAGTITDPGIRDVAIIGGAEKIEHYETAAYEGAITLAQHLNMDKKYIDNLQTSQNEEKDAANKLATFTKEKSLLEKIGDTLVEDVQ